MQKRRGYLATWPLDPPCYPQIRRSQLILIPGENEADFHALFDEFIEDATPRSARDIVAIRQAAQSEWRLRRIAAIEGAMYRSGLKNPPPVQNPGPAEIGNIINRLIGPAAGLRTRLARIP